MWPFKNRCDHESSKSVSCETCKCLILIEDAQMMPILIKHLQGRGEKGEYYFCKIHRKKYDRVEIGYDGIPTFYRTIIEREQKVNRKGIFIK